MKSLTSLEIKKSFPMFGKEVEIILYEIDSIFGEPLLEDIYKEGLRLQSVFNFYDKNSELSKLNNDRKIKASKELLFVIKEALKYCELTKGKYDITKGFEFWQRKKGKEIIKTKCSHKNIVISGNKIELNHDDVLIDLGSIAKGYIVDRMIEFCDGLGIEGCYIDARGDIRIQGNHSEIVAVQHPRNKEKKIHPVVLENSAVATSGDYNQFYGSYSNSHIIGQKEVISATVISDNLMEADALATVFNLVGIKDAEKILHEKQHIKAFLIDKNLKEHFYNGFENLGVR